MWAVGLPLLGQPQALQRPSCKCSSIEAQERKESAEKNKRELAKEKMKKKK